MENIIDKSKELFLKNISDFGSDPFNLKSHISELEKWALYMHKKYPEFDLEIVKLGIYLHDIGHYPLQDEDHAVISEKKSRVFLENENYSRIEEVLHCVRSHRCKDVMPDSYEAKVLAFIDSASHMTDSMYLDIAKKKKEVEGYYDVFGKVDRDFRDLSHFPEVKEELKELHDAWKVLLKAYNNIDV